MVSCKNITNRAFEDLANVLIPHARQLVHLDLNFGV